MCRFLIALSLWHAVGMALIVSRPALSGDWPQWGGRNDRNMVARTAQLPDGFNPVTKWPASKKDAPHIRWVTRLGLQAYGNPTCADGRIFVGTDDAILSDDPRLERMRSGMVQCLDANTGKRLWKLAVPKRDALPKGALFTHQWLGVCSSPTIHKNRIYLISSACEVLCMDMNGQADGNQGPFLEEGGYMVPEGKKPVPLQADDGDIIWRYDMVTEAGVCPHDAASCSVLIHNDVLYTSTSNGVDKPHAKIVAPEAPALIALDTGTGRLLAVEKEGISRRLFHCQWSSPSMGRVNGRDLIFLGGGDGICYAFEALPAPSDKPAGSSPARPQALKKVWSYDCNPPEYRFKDGKPIPYYNGDVRKKKWNKNDGQYIGPCQIIATPVFHDGRVYVAIGQDPAHGRGKGLLHCIDAAGRGDITKRGCIWRYDGLDRTIASSVIHNGLVYCPDIAGRLHCVDAKTGRPVWIYEMQSETWSSPFIADGKLFVGTKKNLWIFRTGRAAVVLSKIRLGTPIYSSAIAVDDALYVASQRYLWAVASKP